MYLRMVLSDGSTGWNVVSGVVEAVGCMLTGDPRSIVTDSNLVFHI